MIPRRIYGQAYCCGGRWSEVMDLVKKYWDQGYFITDFDYGNDTYFVVMSKVQGWNGQAIRYGSSLPADDIKEMWDKDYYITNAFYDGKDWVIVMTGVDYCKTQRYFTTTKWDEFKDKITAGWNDDMLVTKLCCEIKSSYNLYFAAMTEFKDGSPAQSRRYMSGNVTARDLAALCEDGKFIVDIFDFDGGVFVVTAGDTGWSSYRIVQVAGVNGLTEKIKKAWDDGYSLTTLTYYNGEWIAVFGK